MSNRTSSRLAPAAASKQQVVMGVPGAIAVSTSTRSAPPMKRMFLAASASAPQDRSWCHTRIRAPRTRSFCSGSILIELKWIRRAGSDCRCWVRYVSSDRGVRTNDRRMSSTTAGGGADGTASAQARATTRAMSRLTSEARRASSAGSGQMMSYVRSNNVAWEAMLAAAVRSWQNRIEFRTDSATSAAGRRMSSSGGTASRFGRWRTPPRNWHRTAPSAHCWHRPYLGHTMAWSASTRAAPTETPSG